MIADCVKLAAVFLAVVIPTKLALAQAAGSSSLLDDTSSYQAEANASAGFRVLHIGWRLTVCRPDIRPSR